MAETTGIAWCDATFNPWIGCSKVSPGCANCYAERDNKRYGWVDGWGENGERRKTSDANWKKPLAWNRKAAQSGKRLKVFCGSLCDVFEDRMELEEWREDLFSLIEETEYLDWLLLTKRLENLITWYGAASFPNYPDEIRENVWLGTTVENQEMADKRIPILMDIPAKVRFISVEPMLGMVSLAKYFCAPSFSWVICGGESGPGARPMKLSWALDLQDQCKFLHIPFFFKQVGGTKRIDGHWGGDLLDGEEYKEFPTTVAP